ncbi:PopZ family protein [Rhizobium helianthi]|uniref:PopZ family protein n=1 Tax=Rhizobium helianthi TaxID=1132695 RepID=A0ABW4LZU5_9HYPH
MAQPNVAREPSMEEILASIRRIIESNDPVSESEAVRGAQASSYDDQEEEFDIESDYDVGGYMSQTPANDPGNAFAETVRAEHSRMTMENKSAAAVPSQPQEKTLSLADVAARVRAAASRVPEPMTQRVQPNVQPMVSEPVAERAVAQPVPRVVPVEVPQREEYPQERPAVQAASAKIEPVAAPAVAPASDSLPARIEQASLLISDEAGAQIARSFSELSDVVNGLERQTVEDMAKEMLKPMLREWLDDNLPTLVERLVREEIERVARGPRR